MKNKNFSYDLNNKCQHGQVYDLTQQIHLKEN